MDTTKSLLHAFSLPKTPNPQDPSSTTSKPNHGKVDPIATGIVMSVIGANCGHGSLLAIGLEVLRRSATLILANIPDGTFATAQDTIVAQLNVLIGEVKALSAQGVKAEQDAWLGDLKAKVKAPKGAIGGDDAPQAPGAPLVTLQPQQAIPMDSLPKDPAELEKVLTDMLANLKTDKGGTN